MAQILDLCDAVKAALGLQFAGQFTAGRVYVPQFRLQDLGTLAVAVRPAAQKGEVIDRVPTREMAYTVEAGFLQRFAAPPDAAATQAAVDALLGVIEEVGDYLIATPLAVGSPAKTAVGIALANDPAYDEKKLDEDGLLLSVLSVTYRMFR